MSSGLAEAAMDAGPSTVDDEAYQIPTYDEVFPDLPTRASNAPAPVVRSGGVKPGMMLRSSVVTQVCIIAHQLYIVDSTKD